VKIMAGREEVLKIFPRDLRAVLGQVTVDFDRVQEIRMRTQKPLLLICGGREYAVKTDGSLAVGVPDPPVRDIRGSGRCQEQERYWARAGIVTVSQAQMKETVEYMCSFSVYAAEEELRQGFITIQGGHRIGVAGRTMAFGYTAYEIHLLHQYTGSPSDSGLRQPGDGLSVFRRWPFPEYIGDIAAQVR
jgi:stage III sporulation protein AA